MSTSPEQMVEQSGPAGGGPFNWARLAIWLPGVLISAAIVARVAVDAQFYFAPLIIFPILVGIGLGGFLIGLMRIGQVGNRPTIILGTFLAVLISVAGQHYLCYLSSQDNEPKQSPLLEKARRAFPELAEKQPHTQPHSFCEYMHRQADIGRPLLLDYTARGVMVWLSWTIDGLLVLAGACAVVIPTMYLPFCSRCQTWYRSIRGSHISTPIIKQISKTVGVEPVEHLKSGRCRLICCNCGCGPTGCELYWEETTGETFFARVWLDASKRNYVMQLLDQALD
jgi:hypothetical protein